MCVSRFLCFNGACGFLHVYSVLVDYMFQVYVSIMFLYKFYVFVSRPCFQVVGMFLLRPCFSINQAHVSI
jgi:hypothetical protein